MRRHAFVLFTLLTAVLLSSCGHALKRERLYGRNGWRVGPYEITLHPKFETDSLGEVDKSRITGGIFAVSRMPIQHSSTGKPLPKIEIDSVVILVSDDVLIPVSLTNCMDTTNSYPSNLLTRTCFSFNWEGRKPLENGSCIKYTLHLRDKATNEMIHHTRLESNYGSGLALGHSPYPNPFSPYTTIDFFMPKSGNYTITIDNVIGEQVAEFTGTGLDGEFLEIAWEASNVPSGVYFYRLEVGDYSETKKMVLVK